MRFLCLILVICGLRLGGAQVASFQAGEGSWQGGSITLGNLDADPALEMVFPYRNNLGLWFMDAFNGDGSRVAGFPFAGLTDPINSTATLRDLNDDGKDDLVFTAANRIIALNGANGAILWSTTLSAANYVAHAGYQTVTNQFYMSATGISQPLLPPTARFYAEVSPPLVADTDGDGQLEVITPWKIDPDSLTDNQDYNPFVNDIYGFWGEWGIVGEVWSGAVTFHNAATGGSLLNYHQHQLIESGIALGQANNNPALEIYVMTDSDAIIAFDRTRPHGFLGKGMLHRQFGKDQRFLSGSYLKGVDILTADLDNDGKSEVFAPTTQWGPLWQPHETILDDDGTVLWREWKQAVNLNNTAGWLENASMIPVNPDKDNRADVLAYSHSPQLQYRYWNGVSLVSHPGWPKNFAPFYPTLPVVGDVDGDGAEEIIVGTYRPDAPTTAGTLYVFSLAGAEEAAIPVPGGLKHSPAIGDVNGDGRVDVVYRNTAGRIYVQNFGSSSNASISWAMYRGNKSHDGNFGVSLFPAGTPKLVEKSESYRSAKLVWSLEEGQPNQFRIRRASVPDGPFTTVRTLPASETSFVDTNLASGVLYTYLIDAVYSEVILSSAPVPILSMYSSNLLANGGFEEDDDSHWDKWNTGDIAWTNMVGVTNPVYQGRQAMKIEVLNKSSNSSIKQYNQYGVTEASIPTKQGSIYSFGSFLKSGGFSSIAQHSWEWNSSLTENTNARPSLPWPEYFTPHFKPGTPETGWVYANRTFRMPAGFPNVELRHRMDASSAVTGNLFIDNAFFRELPPTNHSSWTRLIGFGSNWRYFTNTPPSNWYLPGFNVSSWPTGIAKFGAGGGPQNIRTALPQKLSNYYFRTSFTLPDQPFTDLLLAATCTDDYGGVRYPFRVFINDSEVISTGIEAVTGQGNDVKYFDLTPFLDWVVLGTNTFSIMLSNTWQPSWDDIAFDVSLMASAPVNDDVRFISVTRSGQNANLLISSAPGSTLRVESSDLLPGGWELVQVVTNTTGTITVTDSGQNGRPRPGQVNTRYYRVTKL